MNTIRLQNLLPLTLVLAALVGCSAAEQNPPAGTLTLNAVSLNMPAHCWANFTFTASGGTPPYGFHITGGPGYIDPLAGVYTSEGAGITNVVVDDQNGVFGYATIVNYWSLTNDAITAVAEDSAGNTYIGGPFTRACPALSPNAVFVAATGVTDYSVNTGQGFDGQVNAATQLSDGTYVLGGNFQHYNGSAAPYIVKINPDGTVDPTFYTGAGPDGPVTAIVSDANDNIYVGGSFTHYNGNASNQYLVKLTALGAVGTGFTNGGPNAAIGALTLDNNDNLYAIGAFTQFAGTAVHYVIKLDTGSGGSGGLDTAFNTGVTSGPNAVPAALVADDSGNIYIGGSFTTYNGSAANEVARIITSSGALDTTFTSPLSPADATTALAVDSTGVYVAGTFPNGLIKLSLTGPAIALFNVGTGFAGGIPSTSVNALALDGQGNLYVGGNFATYTGNVSGGAVAVSTTTAAYNSAIAIELGTVSTGANLGTVRNIYIPTEANTAAILMGQFTGYGGYAANHIAEFNANWLYVTTFLSTITGFDPGSTTSTVNAIVADANDNIYVGGNFVNYGTTAVNGLAHITGTTGGLVAGFSSAVQAPATVTALALDTLGNLYIGGPFTAYNGTATDSLFALNPTTGAPIATSFNTNLGTGSYLKNQPPNVIAIDTANNVYVGGTGFSVGPFGKIASAGTPAANFGTGWFSNGDVVNDIKFDASNNVLLGGSFAKFQGTTVNNIVKMDATAVIDPTFVPGQGFDNTVYGITPDLGGFMFVAGAFQNYQATAAPFLTQLLTTTAALNTTYQAQVAFTLPSGGYLKKVIPSVGTNLLVISSGGTGVYNSPGTVGATPTIFQNAILIDEVTGLSSTYPQ